VALKTRDTLTLPELPRLAENGSAVTLSPPDVANTTAWYDGPGDARDDCTDQSSRANTNKINDCDDSDDSDDYLVQGWDNEVEESEAWNIDCEEWQRDDREEKIKQNVKPPSHDRHQWHHSLGDAVESPTRSL
jgi:hypothetical protein